MNVPFKVVHVISPINLIESAKRCTQVESQLKSPVLTAPTVTSVVAPKVSGPTKSFRSAVNDDDERDFTIREPNVWLQPPLGSVDKKASKPRLVRLKPVSTN